MQDCFLCGVKVTKVEQINTETTTVFVCEYGNCSRTYQSIYTLNEHQRIRHLKSNKTDPNPSTSNKEFSEKDRSYNKYPNQNRYNDVIPPSYRSHYYS